MRYGFPQLSEYLSHGGMNLRDIVESSLAVLAAGVVPDIQCKIRDFLRPLEAHVKTLSHQAWRLITYLCLGTQ